MTRIEQVRNELGLSRGQAVREADMPNSHWGRIERGSDKAGPLVRGRMAKALGVSPEDLFDDRGWPLLAEETLDAAG